MGEKASKGRFLKPEKLQNHSNEGKGKEKKKERRRRSGKEEKTKKTMVALLVFEMAALDQKGPFGGSVFKNPARITKAPFRAGLPLIKNPPGVKERRVKKVG